MKYVYLLKYREFSIVQKERFLSLCSVKKGGKREYYINKAALMLVGTKMREVRTAKQISIENLANKLNLPGESVVTKPYRDLIMEQTATGK